MDKGYGQPSQSWPSGLPTPDRNGAHAVDSELSPPTPRQKISLIPIDDDPFLSSPETSPRRRLLNETPPGDKRKREADSQTISPSKVVVISSASSGEGLPPTKRPKEAIYIDYAELEYQVKNDPDWLQKRSGEYMVDGDDAGPSEQPHTANPTFHSIDETRKDTATIRQPSSGPDAPPSIVEPVLCKEQQDLVDLILSGRNVFYTGSAGCGKSTVLKAAVKQLRDRQKSVSILAPTGKAALQIDGMTTWSYMGWTPDDHKMELPKLIQKTFRKHVRRRLRQTDVLIIDEISMVENHHLQRMEACLREVRKGFDGISQPFGGLQVILTGDFCQLPPVKPFEFCMFCGTQTKMDEWQTQYECQAGKGHGPFPETDKWAFRSQAWKDANLEHIHLREIHRQNDQQFIKMLQKCRLGKHFTTAEVDLLMNHPCKVPNATRVLCTKDEVSRVNHTEFRKLKTEVHEFTAVDGFRWRRERHPHLAHCNDRNSDGTLKALREHRVDPRVILRVGMVVVLQVNLDLPNGLCNGSQGLICGWEDVDPKSLPKAYRKGMEAEMGPMVITGDYADLKEEQIRAFSQQPHIKQWPKVIFHNGLRRTIYPSCLVNSMGEGDGPEEFSALHRTQIPLVAGWAMSVHKSQGMTLNRVIVDLSRSFEEGQVYVALSRATDLSGLRIDGDSKGLRVGAGGNAEVQEFLDKNFGLEKLLEHH
ncbi:unnamed protein product [Clonostachys rosea]|uniref:ATP-dependent DNA helicase n=1 Tax=Bionectria ochroleuca TaxID=29856 RepID=A0ABY6TT65_BIOOC|nr:unnamed protein product [Clonostachys rosea]